MKATLLLGVKVIGYDPNTKRYTSYCPVLDIFSESRASSFGINRVSLLEDSGSYQPISSTSLAVS